MPRPPIHEHINAFFEKVSLLELSPEKKAEVAKKTKEDGSSDRLYWTEILLSSLIATFGLLQNSVAVIIGAMLIAPLLRPIQGMAFGIATGETAIFFRSAKLLFQSIAVSIFIGMAFAWMIPIKYETSEILARTAPNLLDFFIAIFSATIALLSLSFSRLAESVAGVAMAASLMPPLAVVGIEIAFGNFSLSGGSLFLFLTNLFAILVVGILIFFFYGFHPHQEADTKKMIHRAGFLLGTILLISIPLFQSLINISEKVRLQREIRTHLEEIVKSINPEMKISRLTVNNFSDTDVDIALFFRLPEQLPFFLDSQKEIQQRLSEVLLRKVNMEIEITRIAQISPSPDLSTQKDFSQTLLTDFRKKFRADFSEAVLANIELQKRDEYTFFLRALFSPPIGNPISPESLRDFEKSFLSPFSQKTIHISWLPLQTQNIFPPQKTKWDLFLEKIKAEYLLFLRKEMGENGDIKNVLFSAELSSKRNGLTDGDVINITLSFDIWWPKQKLRPDIEAINTRFMRRQFSRATLSADIRWFDYQPEHLVVSPLPFGFAPLLKFWNTFVDAFFSSQNTSI